MSWGSLCTYRIYRKSSSPFPWGCLNFDISSREGTAWWLLVALCVIGGRYSFFPFSDLTQISKFAMWIAINKNIAIHIANLERFEFKLADNSAKSSAHDIGLWLLKGTAFALNIKKAEVRLRTSAIYRKKESINCFTLLYTFSFDKGFRSYNPDEPLMHLRHNWQRHAGKLHRVWSS